MSDLSFSKTAHSKSGQGDGQHTSLEARVINPSRTPAGENIAIVHQAPWGRAQLERVAMIRKKEMNHM